MHKFLQILQFRGIQPHVMLRTIVLPSDKVFHFWVVGASMLFKFPIYNICSTSHSSSPLMSSGNRATRLSYGSVPCRAGSRCNTKITECIFMFSSSSKQNTFPLPTHLIILNSPHCCSPSF